ncbi:hypothetical protein [Roseovarius pacificus]|uniref:hypothetical protein n=1 Tax=Roseovarius pacificus TaxID=337701 RepID=UPI002A1873DB|nr:hypothetical protein [Roseovarius pacificus]
MSTQASRKLLLSAGAIISLVGVGVFTFVMLVWISIRAERDLGAFPFKEEDWYRFLLPSQFALQDKPVVMLAGPSQVRENLRIERFRDALPDFHIYQGGISLGTIEDTEIALKLIEAAYGKEALPDFVVLGMSVRYFANIPSDRPFSTVINTYSGWTVKTDAGGVEIQPKSRIDTLAARLKFVGKLPVRFNASARIWSATAARALAGWPPTAALLNAAGLEEFWARRILKLEYPTTPYKFSRHTNRPVEQVASRLTNDDSWFVQVVQWDAKGDRIAASMRLRRLMAFLEENDISVAVINMPERAILRESFTFDYEEYLGAIRDVIGKAPFIDMRTFARDEEFHDAEHTLPMGSRRMTDHIVTWLKPILYE